MTTDQHTMPYRQNDTASPLRDRLRRTFSAPVIIAALLGAAGTQLYHHFADQPQAQPPIEQGIDIKQIDPQEPQPHRNQNEISDAVDAALAEFATRLPSFDRKGYEWLKEHSPTMARDYVNQTLQQNGITILDASIKPGTQQQTAPQGPPLHFEDINYDAGRITDIKHQNTVSF